jgi:hypothetical protein
MFAVIWVEEFTVQEFTVIPEPKLHPTPVWKFVPAKTTLRVAPRAPEFGVAEVSVGAGSVADWRTSTQARSAVGIVPCWLAPTSIARLGFVSVIVVLPSDVHVLPPSSE